MARPAMCMFVPGVCVPVKLPERSNLGQAKALCNAQGFLHYMAQFSKIAQQAQAGHFYEATCLFFPKRLLNAALTTSSNGFPPL